MPLAALQYGLAKVEVSLLVAVLPTVQCIVYYGACQVHFWHYRRLPLVMVGVGGTLGAVLLYVAYSQPMDLSARVVGTAMGLLLVALCFPLYYTSSLLYGLNARTGRGAKTSIHEGLVGVGTSIGPMMGGLIAAQWAYSATFLLAAATVAAAVVIQLVLLRGARHLADHGT